MWRKSSAFWGLRNERRHQPPGAGDLVRAVVSLVFEGRKMKNARPAKAVSSVTRQGAQIIAPGRLPVRQNTVTAEVLCRFLSYERLTGLDAVTEASTTRLAAYVDYLKGYGWTTETVSKATGCADGRVTTISEYWLPAEVIAAAMAAGAGAWCASVRIARKALRAKAAQARREAERTNAARRARRDHHPGQGWLFEGGLHE
jgi:hypothetical protein